MKNALIVFLSLVWTWQAFAQDFGGIISPIPCAQSPALPNAGDLGCAYVAVPDTQGGVPATWFVPPGEEIDDFFVTTTLMGIKSTQYWSDWTSRFFTVIEIDTVEYADASGFTSLAVFDCAEWDMYYTVWGTAAGRDGGDPWDFLGPYKHLSNSLGQWKPNAMCVPSNNEDYDEATTGTFGEPDWTAGIFDLGICFGVDVDQDNQEDCVVVISGNPNPSSDGPNATAEGEIWHECGNGCTEQERVDEITSVLGPIISAALQSKAFADIFGDNDDWNPLYTYAVNFRNVVGDTITYDRTTFEIEMYKDANGNRTFGVGNFEHNDEVYSYTVPNVPSTPDWSLFHFVW
ncbi:MAG: hypothetical protein R3268_04395, partial [Acidiferrobacterales bacterium]|nr:hypothetical protein [Acidiferrobacterales bacterium]